MRMASGDKCLDAGLGESPSPRHTAPSPSGGRTARYHQFPTQLTTAPANGTPLKVWDCYDGYDAQNFQVHDGRIELVGKGEWPPCFLSIADRHQILRGCPDSRCTAVCQLVALHALHSGSVYRFPPSDLHVVAGRCNVTVHSTRTPQATSHRNELTPGLCVDVPGGVKPGPGNQAPQLQLWACSGGPNQEWDPVCE